MEKSFFWNQYALSIDYPGHLQRSIIAEAIDNIIDSYRIDKSNTFGKWNLSYKNWINNSESNIPILTKSASQIEELQELINLANSLKKPIILVTRNIDIKKIVLGLISTLWISTPVYIEEIWTICNNTSNEWWIHTQDLKNGIISFFDIPNIGKNTEKERNFIEYIQEDLTSMQIFFSNFSDKFKSNTGLRDSLNEKRIIDNNGTDVKKLNESDKHGNLKISEIKLDEDKDNNRYKQLLQHERKKNETYIWIINWERNAEEILDITHWENIKICHITAKNIWSFHSNELSLNDYDLVLLEDEIIGFLDVSNTYWAIYFDYISLDKTRKIAKQLIYKQIGIKKHLISPIEKREWYKQDNPSANRFNRAPIEIDIANTAKNKNTWKKKIQVNKTYTQPLDSRLGLTKESNIKRLDDEMLIELLINDLNTHGIQDIRWLYHQSIMDIRVQFRKIPLFQELIKRNNIRLLSLKRADIIEIFTDIWFELQVPQDTDKLEGILEEIPTYNQMDKRDITILSEKLLWINYKDKLIAQARKQLEQLGIKNKYDLSFYLYYTSSKPKHLRLDSFDSNKKDSKTLVTHLKKPWALHLAVYTLIPEVKIRDIDKTLLRDLIWLLYSSSTENNEKLDFLANINEEILQLVQDGEDIESNNSFIENFNYMLEWELIEDSGIKNLQNTYSNLIKKWVKYIASNLENIPYLNLYSKIKWINISVLTHEDLQNILVSLINERNLLLKTKKTS